MLLAYVGPDTLLPVASALAAAFGTLLMFWRFLLRAAMRAIRYPFRRPTGPIEGLEPAADSSVSPPIPSTSDAK